MNSPGRALPLWPKIAYGVFVLVLVPVYWNHYGPQNFLWFSDIGLLGLAIAMWLESRLLASMTALAVIVPEIAWNVDFFFELFSGRSLINLADYMFDPQIPLGVRLLSLAMPITLAWVLYRLGYDSRALIGQTILAWIVFPLTWVLTTPEQNINWVWGFGGRTQQWMAPVVWVGLLMVGFPLLVYLPPHVLFRRIFRRPHSGVERHPGG